MRSFSYEGSINVGMAMYGAARALFEMQNGVTAVKLTQQGRVVRVTVTASKAAETVLDKVLADAKALGA